MLKRKLYIVACISIICTNLFQVCKSNSITSVPLEENNHINPESFSFDSLSVEEIKELILGNWEWTHSIIMQRGLHPPDNIITPLTSGYTLQRSFESNGIVSYSKNNQLTAKYSYEIKRFKVLPTDEGYVTEIYIDKSSAELSFSHPDTMMIGNGWSDGIDAYFYRKK